MYKCILLVLLFFTDTIRSQILAEFDCEIITYENKRNKLYNQELNVIQFEKSLNFTITNKSIVINNQDTILIDLINVISYDSGVIIFKFVSIRSNYFYIFVYDNEIIKVIYEDNTEKITYHKKIFRC